MENVAKSTCESNMKRIEQRLDRQDESIKGLKKLYTSINNLVRSVDNLAIETKYMREEQGKLKDNVKELDGRMDTIEKKPAKKWEDLIWYVFITIVGAILFIVFTKIGLK